VIGIGRVSAERVLAECKEMEGAESRGIVGEETGSSRDVGEDDGMREAGVGENSGIEPAMQMMMASGTRVTYHDCGQTGRTRWASVGTFASGYRGALESILFRSDRQVRLRCGNRCRGTCTDPAGRAAGSARP
jgi:hypothetical protein